MVITQNISIVDYNSSHREDFKSINLQWLKESLIMEESDLHVIYDPEHYILKNGGCILIALYNNEVAGTCGLINEGNGIYELTKMAVSPAYRGHQIGYHLGMAMIEKAKSLHAKNIILFSNRGYSFRAIHLYGKMGFTEIPVENSPWKNADIKMELNLSS